LGDVGLFVPPAEAAAEGFCRALAEHRYPQARRSLSAALATVDPKQLAALQAAIEGKHGPVHDVRGEVASLGVSHATSAATVSLRFPRATHRVTLPLRRERGLWKVASVDPLRALDASR
jgi:hypothetical protein